MPRESGERSYERAIRVITQDNPGYRRELGGGLVLRWSKAADEEALVALYRQVFRQSKDAPPNSTIGPWVRDMMSGRHPLLGAGDFALVEDTDAGKIVAATCLMDQVWEYEGIALPVGRPEIVASDEDYRERGLVRAVFELIHARRPTISRSSPARASTSCWRWTCRPR